MLLYNVGKVSHRYNVQGSDTTMMTRAPKPEQTIISYR